MWDMCVGFIVRQSELLAILTHLCPSTGPPASQHSRQTCPLNPSYGVHVDLVSDLRRREGGWEGGREEGREGGRKGGREGGR